MANVIRGFRFEAKIEEVRTEVQRYSPTTGLPEPTKRPCRVARASVDLVDPTGKKVIARVIDNLVSDDYHLGPDPFWSWLERTSTFKTRIKSAMIAETIDDELYKPGALVFHYPSIRAGTSHMIVGRVCAYGYEGITPFEVPTTSIDAELWSVLSKSLPAFPTGQLPHLFMTFGES